MAGNTMVITALGAVAIVSILLRFPDFPVSAPPNLRQRLIMMANRRVAATVGITFLTSVASLGLYTYVSSILLDLAGIHTITAYLWVWGIGGVAGSFFIGSLIDRTKQPAILMAGILAIMAIAMFSLPFSLHYAVLGFIPFFLWGVTGWASQAPQQHTLLQLQPQQGPAAVALNSSANYLGSSVGASLGGAVLLIGFSPSHLPYLAGGLAAAALIGQGLLLAWSKAGKEQAAEYH